MQKNLPQLIMVMGLPGSGKTYFASALANRINGLHLNSDIIRKQQHQHPQYSVKDKAKVYKAMYDQAHEALKNGKKVIIDATFSLDKYRRPFFQLADNQHLAVILILMKSSEQTIAQRLQKKRQYSDADFGIYKKIKSEFEPLNQSHLILETDKYSLDEMIAQSIEFIQTTPSDDS